MNKEQSGSMGGNVIDLTAERRKRRSTFDRPVVMMRRDAIDWEGMLSVKPFYLLDVADRTEVYSVDEKDRLPGAILGNVQKLFSKFDKHAIPVKDPNYGERVPVDVLYLTPRPGLVSHINCVTINRVPDETKLSPASPRRRVEVIIDHKFISQIDKTTVLLDYNPQEEGSHIQVWGRELLDMSPFSATDIERYRNLAGARERRQTRVDQNGKYRDLTNKELQRLDNLLSDVVPMQV